MTPRLPSRRGIARLGAVLALLAVATQLALVQPATGARGSAQALAPAPSADGSVYRPRADASAAVLQASPPAVPVPDVRRDAQARLAAGEASAFRALLPSAPVRTADELAMVVAPFGPPLYVWLHAYRR